MKKLFSIAVCLVVLKINSRAQNECACCINVVESPAVVKPAEPAIVSVSCSTLVVRWKGNDQQWYLVSGTSVDPATNAVSALANPVSITEENDDCTAVIPVTPGSRVSWNVKAMRNIDERTFSSYTLNGVNDYQIPNCESPNFSSQKPLNATVTRDELAVTNVRLALFPNPVRDNLNVKLQGEFQGALDVVIYDLSGRAVISRKSTKQGSDFSNSIAVSQLVPGNYFLSIRFNNGKSLSARFAKK